ncbi:MAG: hypothetical protein ACI8RZ_001761 [Myxococcota bacterium]
MVSVQAPIRISLSDLAMEATLGEEVGLSLTGAVVIHEPGPFLLDLGLSELTLGAVTVGEVMKASPRRRWADPHGPARPGSLLAVSAERILLGPPIDMEIPTVAARVEVNGTSVRLFGMHTAPPAAPRYADHRDLELADLGQRIAAEDGPVVVVGDLNTTPLARDAREGRGLLGTWLASWPAGLRISIDHVLISEDIVVSEFAVLPLSGSDHRALRVDLSL